MISIPKTCKDCGQPIIIVRLSMGIYENRNKDNTKHICNRQEIQKEKVRVQARHDITYYPLSKEEIEKARTSGQCMIYKCIVCKNHFIAGDFRAARIWTGRMDSITHCGKVPSMVLNLSKQTDADFENLRNQLGDDENYYINPESI